MLKAHRGLEPAMVVKIGKKVFKTPQTLAKHLAANMVYSLQRKVRARNPRGADYWPTYTKAYRRILPHCKWFYNRK